MCGPPYISHGKRHSLNVVGAIMMTGYVLAWAVALLVIALCGKT